MSASRYLLTPEQSLAMADQLIASGQTQLALNVLLQSLRYSPGHLSLSLKLARLLHQHGHNAEAITVLKTCLNKGRINLESSYFLAALLHSERKFNEALKIIDACLSHFPDSSEAYNLKGSTLVELNLYDDAVSAFKQAILLKPESADAYNNLAWAFRALGRKQEAIKHFEKAFSVDNQATEALSGLLLLKTFKNKADEFYAVEKLLKKGSLTEKQSTELRFALGKAYEDIRDFPAAFEHFERANRQWRNTFTYTLETDKRLFDAIKKTFPATQTASDWQVSSQTAERPESQIKPIFIVGMPRSSTTLIEQIISSHSEVAGTGELPFLEPLLFDSNKNFLFPASKADQDALAKRYLMQAQAHVGSQISQRSLYFTDKLPQNFRFVGAILTLFPSAKIIHCKREPMDTCLSLFKHHFPMANHHYAYDLKELGQYYQLYEGLMAHWHKVIPGKIYDIQYETLVNNFEEEVMKLLAYCELEFESECLTFERNKRIVRTASSDQVRQGLFKEGAGRWQNYKHQLAPLKASLQSYS